MGNRTVHRLRRTRTCIGDKLRALRVATGTHMRDVAHAVGCHWNHLRMIEGGYRQPSEELMYRLAHELSRLHGRTVSIDEFTTPITQDDAA